MDELNWIFLYKMSDQATVTTLSPDTTPNTTPAKTTTPGNFYYSCWVCIQSFLYVWYVREKYIEKEIAPLQQNDVMDPKTINRKMYVLPEWCEEVK